MSMTNSCEQKTLKAILQGTDLDFRASANLYLALFTDDPTEAGLFTNEATYTGYARVAMPKATAWTDGGSSFPNSGLVQFPKCTAGTNTISHFALCTAITGGEMITFGSLNANINIGAGVQPQFEAGSFDVGAD